MGKVGLIVTYPAAEPDALEDKVPVGVVIPLDAMQTSSSADHQRWSSPVASSRATSDTPQKRDCRLPPRGGSTGYAVYAMAYPAIKPCTGVNIGVLCIKKRNSVNRTFAHIESPPPAQTRFTYFIHDDHNPTISLLLVVDSSSTGYGVPAL